MYIVFAFALVFGMSAVIVPSAATPAGADPGYTEIGASFDLSGGGDTAQWRTTQVHPDPETLTVMGVSSAFLDKAGGNAGPTCVQFTPPAGTTVSDFQAAITAGTPKWSFWQWLEAVGVTNGPQFELRFTNPAYDPITDDGWVEITAVGLQGFTGAGAWNEEILDGNTLAGFGGQNLDGTGFYHWDDATPLHALSGILAEINADTDCDDDVNTWVLTRVRVELYEAIDQSCYIDDITIDGERYDLEQGYRIIPETVAKDVKGTEQKFVILNLPTGMSDIEFLTYANPAQAMDDAQLIDVPQVIAWEVIPGLQKSSVGPPASGADIIITGGGGPTYVAAGGYDGSANGDNWIKIWTRDPGDCNIAVWLDGDLLVDGSDADETVDNDKDIRLITEKKWGDIDHTILDLDPATAIVIDPVTKQIISGQETSVLYVAGTDAVPEYELVDDWIYAWFYLSPVPSTFIDSVGHAVVHWWLIVDDAAGVNEAAIDAIMADLSADGCGTYVDWPDAWGTPFSRIDAVATANPSTKFTFSAVTEGTLWPDPNVDGTFNNDANLNGVIDTPLDTYIKTMTEDDLLGETRGLVEVQLKNTGQENILIITLSEYPWPYAGENPVCIEKGKKTWRLVPPPPEIVKTPQVRWAGEKIVLEQDWSGIMATEDITCAVAVYHVEQQGVGEISIAGDNTSHEVSEGDIWVEVNASDYVSEVLLETEVQGEADVNVKLYKALDCSGGSATLSGQTVVNYGFLVYFLAFEDVVLAEDITPTAGLSVVSPTVDIPVAVQVRGWFTSDELPGTTRIAVDVDGDGIYEMPAGRYVLPDDWWGMVGHSYDIYPNMDLMDQADNDTIYSSNTLGPFNTEVWTTNPPNVAEYPSIGPFNTLQRWSTDQMWISEALTVPSSLPTNYVRNTVVPDRIMSWYDCPMPQALVNFDIVASTTAGGLSTLGKGNLLNYGYTGTPKVYHSPFYQAEIPSHTLIPVIDYEWDSWSLGGDDPYPYWTDVKKKDWDDSEPTTNNDQDVEVYCDNHGIAGVTVDALLVPGTITIVATAQFPAGLKAGKYAPRSSGDIPVTWGAIELNPHFVADKVDVAVEEVVTFDNLTDGGTHPYMKAEWDYDADGVIDDTFVNLTSNMAGEATVMADATNAYSTAGVYTVRLWMTDSTPTTRYEERPDYITVAGAVPTETLTMQVGVAQDPAGYNNVMYFGDTVSLPTGTEPACLVAVYYYDAATMTLLYFFPGGGSNMTELIGNTPYIIIVDDATVADPCEWVITQP